jgi:hypothetical protein
VLLQFLHFGSVQGDLLLLRVSILHDFFEVFVENFVFVSLDLDICLELFVVLASLDLHLVHHGLRLLNQDVHHHIDLLPYLVGLLLENLKQVVPIHQSVLQSLDLLVDVGGNIVDASVVHHGLVLADRPLDL